MRICFYTATVCCYWAVNVTFALAQPSLMNQKTDHSSENGEPTEARLEVKKAAKELIATPARGGHVKPELIQEPAYDCSSPSVDQVIQAALKHADLEVNKAVKWERNVRWAALLPQFSARVNHSASQGALLSEYLEHPDKINLNSYFSWRWEVRATWDLSRLVFDSREMSIAARGQQLAAAKQKMLEKVGELYFERCHLLLMGRTGEEDQEAGQPLRQQLRLRQLTAMLNVMTGGLFSYKDFQQ